MYTTSTAPVDRIHDMGDSRLLLVLPAPSPVTVAASEISDLIDAAGPLTISDIAAGLATPVCTAVARVRPMVRAGQLSRDEFGRYRLHGAH